MPCQAIRLWTFNGLVAAFLDLCIAHLLLCASTLVFSTSKFLGLFGFCLPCPCDGHFGNLTSDHCFQKLLLDRSSKRISSVLSSVKERSPFDSMFDNEPNCCLKSMLLHERNVKDRHVELGGEMSCSSYSLPDIKGPEKTVVGLICSKEGGKFYTMENGVACQTPGNCLHHRRKVVTSHRDIMTESSNDILQMNMEDKFQSPSSICTFGDNNTEQDFFSVDSGDEREASTENRDREKLFPELVLGDSHDDRICRKVGESSAEEAGDNGEGELGMDGNESDTMRLLKQALEEEQSARATLYLELEKERSAAATAADEAMAMILRLQEEKASIEMDARQYQRIIEEKTAYDAEEMRILKEILLRREREMHFLEKELEAYSEIIYENNEVDADMPDAEASPQRTPLIHSTEDTSHMLQLIDRSNGEKEYANYAKSSSNHETPSAELRNLTFEFGEETPIIQVAELTETAETQNICIHQDPEANLHKLNDGEESNNGLQETCIVPGDEISSILQGEANELGAYLHIHESNGLSMNEKSITSIGADHKKRHSVTDIDLDSRDILVIVDEASVNSSRKPVSDSVQCDSPFFGSLERELDITSSSSDSFRPMSHSRGNPLRSQFRRNSMSAVDYERSKLGDEVEWLRERLKVVQEGREKLKFTTEYKEKENNQLQILENMTNHLRELRQLTDPEKTTQQALLPPISKGMSKNRCWRSSSLSIHRSS